MTCGGHILFLPLEFIMQKLNVMFYGDRSVGEGVGEVVIDMSNFQLPPDYREIAKKDLTVVLEELYGAPCCACWEDECPDCGKVGYAFGQCSNGNCISNAPEET